MKISLTLFLLLSFISCEQIIDNYFENKERENYTSPYIGTWVGTYSGNENGIIKIVVNKSGRCDVTLSEYNGLIKETFYGTVTDYGAFNSTYSLKTGFKLYGNFVLRDNNGSGT